MDHEPLVSLEQVAAAPQNKEIVPGKSELTGKSSMFQGASLPGLEEPKGVEVTAEDSPAYAEALEPKPELLQTGLDREESSVAVVPDYCQEIEVKHEDWEKLPCHPVRSEDQFWSGLVTTHFEVKEGILEQPGEDLRQESDSAVVQLPKVDLSAEAEESILDHPRLAKLKGLKEGDSVVPGLV